MSWAIHHTQSEELASQAEEALRKGDKAQARKLYRLSAEAEESALASLGTGKQRTLGITAVSAASLWFKAGAFEEAERLARHWIDSSSLPEFARIQMQEILQVSSNVSSNMEAPHLEAPHLEAPHDKAIVFTHVGVPRELLPVDDPVKRLGIDAYLEERIEMYRACPAIGRVYLFIAEGYQAVLGQDRPWEGLEKERILRESLVQAIERSKTTNLIQIVGTPELTPTMARLSKLATHRGLHRLGDLLLGRQPSYDSPKVVEAVIRLARAKQFGKEPIFRFDADVDLDDDNVRRLLRCYDTYARRDWYFFSGGYRSRTADPVDELLNGYAVRVAQFCDQTTGGEHTLEQAKARRFLEDLGSMGADPARQVISGSGLCMSPAVIRLLPPFANIGDLVTWIDDHLKRVLLEDLDVTYFGPPKEQHRRCEAATFVQDRHPHNVSADDVRWHGTEYLERLVRGCLLDSLMRDRSPFGQGRVAGHVHTFLKQRLRAPGFFLQQDLEATARERFAKILETWTDAAYAGTLVRKFADDLQAAPGRQEALIHGVIADIDAYIELLAVWDGFVDVCEHIEAGSPGNQWLFGEP